MKQPEMKYVAELMYKVLIERREPRKVKEEVVEFRRQYTKVHYCFTEEDAPKIVTLLELLS
jgi:glycine hydroxymethyltransferase